jgi:cytochrome c553
MSLALLLGAGAAQAQEMPAERAKLMALVEQATKDEAKHKMAIAAGEERISSGVCAQCHGHDGTATKPLTPNLAGQNAAYMLEQWEKFADGRRKNFVMQVLAKNFTMEEKVNIIVYYESLKPKPAAADPVAAQRGARIFQSVCKLCHGEDGRGEQGYARIAGQPVDYVTLTLKRFRDNAHQAVAAEDVKRSNVRMEQVAQSLSDADIEGLANYIALLK